MVDTRLSRPEDLPRLVLSFGASDNHDPKVVGKIVRVYSLEHGIYRTEKRFGKSKDGMLSKSFFRACCKTHTCG